MGAAKTVFRKGSKAGGKEEGGVFVRAKEDEALSFAPLQELEDMVSIDQHEYWDTNPAVIFPCIGKVKCPACAAGNKAKYKGFLSVAVSGETKGKILSFGLSVERQFVEINGELGTIKGSMFKLRRTGAGLSTKYTLVAVGKKVDVEGVEPVDVEKHINVLTAEEISEKISMFEDAAAAPTKVTIAEPAATADGDWAEV